MKKLFVLSAAGLLALAAQAQQSRRLMPDAAPRPASEISTSQPAAGAAAARPTGAANKGTAATAFVTDSFNANSIGTGGWIATGNTGADSWKYTNASTTPASFVTGLRSTTSANGWLAYDAYNIALGHANVNPQIGDLTSPAYNCTGHTYVGLRFQQYATRFADTFYVFVSSDSFATSTRYGVFPNNSLPNGTSTDNPTITTINISAAAANKPKVRVRFEYYGAYTGTGRNGSGGTYGWAIDDFQLLDLDPVDLAVSRSGVVMPLHNKNGYTTFASLPRQFADSLFAATRLYNLGGTAQTNATVTATIYGNSTSVPHSQTFANVPINASDSIVDFRNTSGFLPTGTGSIVTAFNVNQAGDGTVSNNTDTVFQNITDSVWSYYRAKTAAGGITATGGYYIQRPASGSAAAVAYYVGTLFEVGAGKSDTLTSVDVAFYPGGTVNSRVRVEIYKEDENTAGSYNQLGSTFTKALKSSDFSPSGGITYTKFLANIGTGSVKTYPVMSEGEYYVVITGIDLKPSAEVTVLYTKAESEVLSSFGIGDTSVNTGGTFGTAPRSRDYVPVMRLNFSNDAKSILTDALKLNAESVQGTAYDLNAYPNPAGTDLAVSFRLPQSGAATVRLMNTVGQVMMTQSVKAVSAGQPATAHFNTASLASGMYYYSVESDGQRAAGRVVVSH